MKIRKRKTDTSRTARRPDDHPDAHVNDMRPTRTLSPECLAEPLQSSPSATDRALRAIFRRAVEAGVAVTLAVASAGCQDDGALTEEPTDVAVDAESDQSGDSGSEIGPSDTSSPDDVTLSDGVDSAATDTTQTSSDAPDTTADVRDASVDDSRAEMTELVDGATDSRDADALADASNPTDPWFEMCPDLASPACDYDADASALRGELGVDYVGIYESPFDPWEARHPYLIGSAGVACSGATEGDSTCGDRVAAETQAAMSQQRFILTTDGDEVVRTEALQLIDRIGPLDSTWKAVLFVWLSHYDFDCDVLERGAVTETPSGFKLIATRTYDCPISTEAFLLQVSNSGDITVLDSVIVDESGACVGRRPDGLVATLRDPGGSALGRYWAEIAHLEAAAVVAFENLADELAQFGAPQHLIAGCRRAAQDEVHHAEITAELARKYGCEPIEPEVEPRRQRSLEAFALDNAVEGCVRETYGALMGTWQGEHAGDPDARRVMRIVAEDETRHSSLSWQIAAWLEDELDDDAIERVMTAQQRAIASVRRAALRPRSPVLAGPAGLPSAAQSEVLLEHLESTIWQV